MASDNHADWSTARSVGAMMRGHFSLYTLTTELASLQPTAIVLLKHICSTISSKFANIHLFVAMVTSYNN